MKESEFETYPLAPAAGDQPPPSYPMTQQSADQSLTPLHSLSHFYIQQSNTGFGTITMFQVLNDQGQLIFSCTLQRIAVPRTGGYHQRGGAQYSKTMYSVNDATGALVLTAVSETNTMLVTSGANYSLGTVDGGFTGSNYTATSAVGLGTFQIQSQKSTGVFGEVEEFRVFANGVQQIGVMKRGIPGSPYMHLNNFGMTFPQDLDVPAKALLFACGILMYDQNYVSTVFRTGGGIRGTRFTGLVLVALIFGGFCVFSVIAIAIVFFIFMI